MATEIKVWQIINDRLELSETKMSEMGRTENEDLKKWIKSTPSILGEDILLIGEEVPTKSGGRIDLLGIDKLGNLVIMELKRDKLPRDVLAQAIDYASDVALWDVDEINEVCMKYTGQTLEDYLIEKFEDVDLENLKINISQRILIIGFSIEESLQRMIEWLSEYYNVGINAVILKYIKTKNGEELLARTVIIPEEKEMERIKKKQIQISMSDEPGNYPEDKLKELLKKYLSENRDTPRRIRKILLPLCLEYEVVTREIIQEKLMKEEKIDDKGTAGKILSTISKEIGHKKNDYLRQIISYDKVGERTKENYKIRPEYKELIHQILCELNKKEEKEN